MYLFTHTHTHTYTHIMFSIGIHFSPLMMTSEVKDSSTLFFDTSEGVNNMKPFPDE